MRFEWKTDAPFQFFPKVGHLHPGCAKGITVILKSDVPATFRRHLVSCKVTKINFELPQRKVPDWDDKMCIVTWKEMTKKDLAASWPKKEKVRSKMAKKANPAFTQRTTITHHHCWLSSSCFLWTLDSREVHQQCIPGERWKHSDWIHSHERGKPFGKRPLATHKLHQSVPQAQVLQPVLNGERFLSLSHFMRREIHFSCI
uniref:uncharacterized protein n=1 Tax=Lonchura striata TaxID=40157 RepID=UPI001293A300|nr:uncharacterized protein LOC116184065 [Lonchura striata domestica]